MTKVHGNSKHYLGKPRQETHRSPRMQRQKEWQYSKRRDHMAALNNMKWLAGCKHCGTHDERVLDFDHLPEFEKVDNISSMRGGRWDKLMTEVGKCQVLCRNCHHIVTMERRRLNSGKLMSATP